MLAVQITFAQERTITGTVVDEDGLPLPGVTVLIKGTNTGTQTDFDGNYSIPATQGDVLVYSFVGMETTEYTVGNVNTIDVTLATDSAQLDEVVVTALGISREKKSLGYSTTEVGGEELSEGRNTNAINSLSGRVAGIQVSNSAGSLGGSSRILLRGAGSITQENKPLYVVDGIPLDNSNYNTTSAQTGGGGRDYGDAGADINPDNIESMTVLKGGAAAALYGSRANNGVIIITTKSGADGKGEITVNSGVSFESAYILPQVQKKYGGGAGNPATIGQTSFAQETIDGTTYNIVDYGTDETWGPRFDPNTEVLHWDAFNPEFPDQYLNPRPWVYPEGNDAESFFRTGVTTNNSVAFSNGNDRTNYRVSAANIQQEGIVPNSSLDKTTFNFSGKTQIGDNIEVNASMNYTVTDGFNRPASGYTGAGVIQQFYQFGQTQLDHSRLRNYKLPDGTQRPWNRVGFDDGTPRYSDNPYWTINENTATDERIRYYGTLGLKYNFTDDFYATANFYSDTYNFEITDRVRIGSQAQSGYHEFNTSFEEYNYEGRLHYDTTFGDKFSLNAFAGTNRRDVYTSSLEGRTQGGLVVDNIYNLNNSTDAATIVDRGTRKRVNSVFGSASLGYDNFAYLTVTGRNDWSSTLPADNNSYFYPSLNGSLVFSQFVDADWLSFGKLRAGWARVGNDTDPYRLNTTFENNPDTFGNIFFGNIIYTQPDEKLNPELGPETKDTWEVGLEMSFLDRRISFDVTYYDETTTDLITPVQVDPSAGYTSTFVNAGTLSNKGIEALVSVIPVQTEDFTWNASWNFAKNVNKLEALLPGVNTLELARFPFNGVTLNAVVGEEYGQIRGTNYVFDDQGNRVVDAEGRYMETPNVENLGSVLPDFKMGFRNSFEYKGINLGILIDWQKGGKYRSLTNLWGHYSGILEETAVGNIREEGIVLDGVTGDVTFNDDGTYEVTNTANNEQVISAQQYGTDFYLRNDAQNVFDADYVKLREITLGYTLPGEWLGDTVNNVTISAFGRNLLAWGLDNDNFDPEAATSGSGNIQGSEGGALPSTRTYGLNLQLKF